MVLYEFLQRIRMDKCLSEKDLGILLSEPVGNGKTVRHRQHLRICDTCARRLAELRVGSKGPQCLITTPSHATREESNMSIGHSLEPNMEIGDFHIWL